MTFCKFLFRTYLLGLPVAGAYNGLQLKKELVSEKVELFRSGMKHTDKNFILKNPEIFVEDLADLFIKKRKDLIAQKVSDTLLYPVYGAEFLTKRGVSLMDNKLYDEDLQQIRQWMKREK